MGNNLSISLQLPNNGWGYPIESG